ncbi:hypothetical protein KGA66_12945 [Actinocrinis puniceicyclus]|uniref:Uncharacterized protein n=1 Tax=Actinocrinis puniceicyclus TaxID=977794 RepID=A0A8J7WKG9_9ACTN|nr:hypothetical protein [Actinocrinis puniceicyclus]MBS2963956.1 hypothetical protein [Actinocrinis puniceicyclus]
MKMSVDVADDVYSKVRLLGQAWGVDDNEVIRRLLESFQKPATVEGSTDRPETEVPVHVIFEKVRTEAVYDQVARSITISSGPLAGQAFSTPSGAAAAVIKQYRPDVSPSRNGWSFWTITADGNLLQSIR